MGLIDPHKIPEKDLPLIVLTDDRRGFLSWAIKSHSDGNYSHIMEMHESGYVASQDFAGFRKSPIEKYMQPYIFMKFWRIKDLTKETRKLWLDIIQADLDAPWKDRRYDILGMIGQLFRIRWLQNPHLKYCSERVNSHMKMALSVKARPQPTPSEINAFLKTLDIAETYGYWFEH